MSGFAGAGPGRLARLPTFCLDRPRLLEMIRRRRSVWVLCAPAGYGKTTLVTQAVLASADSWRYVRLSEGDDAATVYLKLSCAAGAQTYPATLHSTLDAFDQSGIANIVIDDADLAGASGCEALRLFCASLDGSIGVTLCARSNDRIIEPRWLCDGTAQILGWDDLAFDEREIEALCLLMGVPIDAGHAAILVEHTRGWPMIVAGALHATVRRRAPLKDALQIWEDECARAVKEFAVSEARRSRHGARFVAVLEDQMAITPDDLHAWERDALFVIRNNGVAEVLPSVRRAFEVSAKEARGAALEPMVAKLFGELHVSIGGVPVKWIRRKDAQVFKYLLLKSDGTASRRELMEMFWPGRDAHVAAQNLRTTCSNIRRAMRRVVGDACSDAYFRSDDDIRVMLKNAITDVAEFQGHLSAIRMARAQGANRFMLFHLERARELYRGDLLAGMPPCGNDEFAAELRRSFGEVLHLLRVVSLERGPLAAVQGGPEDQRASA